MLRASTPSDGNLQQICSESYRRRITLARQSTRGNQGIPICCLRPSTNILTQPVRLSKVTAPKAYNILTKDRPSYSAHTLLFDYLPYLRRFHDALDMLQTADGSLPAEVAKASTFDILRIQHMS